MKKSTLFFVLFFLSVSLSAQKLALHSNTGVQHFTGINALIDAYDTAVSGDTIYLPGGGFTAPSSIDKSLLIYGAGHYPDSTQATAKTYINGNIALSDNADGFHMEGVHINGNFNFDYNESVNNVVLKYCRMNDLNVSGNSTFNTPSENLTVINCVINGTVTFSNGQNQGLFNSIIQGRILYSFGNLFENNIFMYSYSGTSSYYSISGDNNICNNNIFLNASYRYFNGVSNQIYNNIFLDASPLFGTTPIYSGNYSSVVQSNIFIDQTGNAFDYEHNYHLQDPVTYTGTDATELGIYGGTQGYKEGAVPSNPHIQLQNISPTTDENGNLSIQINVSAQDK